MPYNTDPVKTSWGGWEWYDEYGVLNESQDFPSWLYSDDSDYEAYEPEWDPGGEDVVEEEGPYDSGLKNVDELTIEFNDWLSKEEFQGPSPFTSSVKGLWRYYVEYVNGGDGLGSMDEFWGMVQSGYWNARIIQDEEKGVSEVNIPQNLLNLVNTFMTNHPGEIINNFSQEQVWNIIKGVFGDKVQNLDAVNTLEDLQLIGTQMLLSYGAGKIAFDKGLAEKYGFGKYVRRWDDVNQTWVDVFEPDYNAMISGFRGLNNGLMRLLSDAGQGWNEAPYSGSGAGGGTFGFDKDMLWSVNPTKYWSYSKYGSGIGDGQTHGWMRSSKGDYFIRKNYK